MRKICIVLPSLICAVSLAGTQQRLPRRPSPPAEFVFGPGDQVVVHVEDLDEVSDKPIHVDPSGYIDLPLAGRVQVSGLTPAQLQAELTTRYARYITTPRVSVNIAASSSQPVSVVGEVNNSGVHQLGGSRRLLEVLSLWGGLKPDAGANVIVAREPRWGAIAGGSINSVLKSRRSIWSRWWAATA